MTLILSNQIQFGQDEPRESSPRLPPEAEVQGVLPELSDPTFLALPFDPVEIPDIIQPPVGFQLPPVALFLPPRATPVATVRLGKFKFSGNTVFSDKQLNECVKGFLNKPMLPEDLEQLGFEITRLYISNGYLNSGATIPSQNITDGVLDIRITEGRLTEVLANNNKVLSDPYLSWRILMNRNRPLHFPTLQKQLQILQENPNIQRLNAELKPGLVPGEALMVVEVEELPKWSYGMDFHNQRSPSVGGEQADLWLQNNSLTGFSDTFVARLGVFSGAPEELDLSGLDTYSLRYERPILADDTSLQIGWSVEDYSILEEPFTDLSIDGKSQSFFAGIRHPLYRSLQDELWSSFLLELSHDETSVLGRPFSISPGAVDGELDLTVLRFGLDWTRRTRESVFSLRALASVGIDALGATDAPNEPNSEFVAWFLESQYSRRINERGDLLVLHGGCGLSNDSLPPPAQIRVGGRYTVRGFRENFLVRDSGCYAGADYQIPLISDAKNLGWNFWLVPFIDAGVAWTHEESNSETIAAAGIGIRANYSDWFRSELYFGVPLSNQVNEGDDIQDQGIQFRISVGRF